jgi:glycosyltransferase involved in cell wall biosynthesis
MLTCEMPVPPPHGKDIDVFIAGRLQWSSTVRERGAAELRQLQKEGIRIEIDEGHIPPSEYLTRCARAWLVWAPEGYGWDCFRSYEAAIAGSVPLISRQTIERHRPLIDNEHCIYYDLEPGQLTKDIRQALQARDRLLEMSDAAREHVLRHHTPQALAHHVVNSTLEAARQSTAMS